MLAWALFGAFSLAGGLATSLEQLIAFRTFQGVGGSGLYTMTFVLGVQVTPVRLYGTFSSVMGIMFAVGSVLGMFRSVVHIRYHYYSHRG